MIKREDLMSSRLLKARVEDMQEILNSDTPMTREQKVLIEEALENAQIALESRNNRNSDINSPSTPTGSASALLVIVPFMLILIMALICGVYNDMWSI